MPNGRPGDSLSHDILHHKLSVFGSPADDLVREIDARIAPEQRRAFIEMIETWPWNPEGTPRDTEALVARLLALRETLGPAPPEPPPAPPPASPPAPPPGPHRGSPAAAVVGLVIGGVVGLPLGLLAYVVARETGLLPPALWSSDGAMWAIIGGVAAAAAALGAKQGAAPGRLGHALLIGLLGCFVAGAVCGLAAGLVSFVIGAVVGVSQREGSFAMGVLLGIVPAAALLGGLCGGIWTGRRAWREWKGPRRGA